MSGPSSTSFNRPDLGQSFDEFDMVGERMGYIGTRALPVFDCALQTANFSKVPIEQLLKDRNTERAPGAGYSRDRFSFTQDSYTCVEHGAEEPIDDRERAIYSYTVNFEQVSADRALNAVLRDLEQIVSAAVFNATTWTGAALTTAISTEWSTGASAVPIDNVLAAKQKVRASCGMLPNAVIMDWSVFNALQLVDQIIDQIKFSGRDDPKNVTLQALAALFQVDEVIVSGSVKNTANEGQSAVLGNTWDDEYVMVAKVAKSSDLQEPCIGRLFHFTGDGSTPGVTMEMYREEASRADILRARMDYQAKIIYPEAGHLLSNIMA